MSMYAEYLKEHTNDCILETDRGFATYRFIEANNTKSCYIIDIYVRPDYRKTKEASTLADNIVSIAKERGCTELLGTVVPSANNSTASLKVLLGYGMTLHMASNNLIVFRKEIA